MKINTETEYLDALDRVTFLMERFQEETAGGPTVHERMAQEFEALTSEIEDYEQKHGMTLQCYAETGFECL